MPLHGTIALIAVAIFLLSPSRADRPSRCQIWKSDILRSEESLTVSRSYKGLWVSEKCEILPGPRFQLRRYHFLKNGRFHLTRFLYSDPWCTSATFSATAWGAFQPPPERAAASSASWVVPGGLELDYTLRRVTIVPFTVKAAKVMSEMVNVSCPGHVQAGWQPYRKYKVLSFDDMDMRNKAHLQRSATVGDFDCTSSLDVSFNELQLMRLEHRTPLHFAAIRRPVDASSGRYQSYLFLGAVKRNSRNRPTYYQVPMVPSKALSCTVCQSLSKSSPVAPPELPLSRPRRLPSPGDLDGHWISLRCETRPYGLFLRREFVFRAAPRHWTGRHRYFRDPRCGSPMFTLAAEGSFAVGRPSEALPGALECDFDIRGSSLTPQDRQFVANLKGLSSCGPAASWVLGRAVNLSGSGGCAELGVAVPSTELELVRLDLQDPEVPLLYLGDGTEDRSRPTSFQSPLARCPQSSRDDDNLLFNDLRPMPLVSSSGSGSWLRGLDRAVLVCAVYVSLRVVVYRHVD